jgi:metal-responsive CopG/Arc/MetJ family transcriptional regulator
MKRLVVSVPEAMLDALDAKVAAAQTVDPIDRGAVVRACLAKCLAAELKAAASKP